MAGEYESNTQGGRALCELLRCEFYSGQVLHTHTMYDPRHLLVCTLCRNIVPVTDVLIFTDGMVFSPTKMKILLQEMGSKSVNPYNLSVRRCFQLYFLNVHYMLA